MLIHLIFPSPLKGEGQGEGDNAAVAGGLRHRVAPAIAPGSRVGEPDAGRPIAGHRASRPGRRIGVRRDGRGGVALP